MNRSNLIPRFLFIALSITGPLPASADIGTIIEAGIGLGESTTEGDYTQRLSNTIFTMGFDLDIDKLLFIGRGQSSIGDDFKQMDLIWGAGNKYLKLGTGFIGLQTSVPSNPNRLFDVSGHSATDENKRIDLSVTSIPVYLRVKPLSFENFTLVIDGYYSLTSKGSMTFPFIPVPGGGYATVSSVPKKQGGQRGFSIAATWRLTHQYSALRLAYYDRIATMVKRTSYIKDDVFGILGKVTTPQVTLHNRSILLSYVLVKKIR